MQQQTRLSRQAAAQKEKADALLSGVRLELRQRQEELEAQSAELAWLKHEVRWAAGAPLYLPYISPISHLYLT